MEKLIGYRMTGAFPTDPADLKVGGKQLLVRKPIGNFGKHARGQPNSKCGPLPKYLPNYVLVMHETWYKKLHRAFHIIDVVCEL